MSSNHPPIHLTWLGGPEVERLSLTDDEILGAIETSLAAQGRGETVIEAVKTYFGESHNRGIVERLIKHLTIEDAEKPRTDSKVALAMPLASGPGASEGGRSSSPTPAPISKASKGGSRKNHFLTRRRASRSGRRSW